MKKFEEERWLLRTIICGIADEDDEIEKIKSLEDAGILTGDRGLVISFKSGREYQVTIRKTK